MNSHSTKSRLSMPNNSINVATFLFFLLLAYLITISGLLLMAFLLYKIPLADSAVNIGIIIIYIVSTFLAAFFCGRKMKQKKFIWGFLLGISYFAILFIISFITKQSLDTLGNNIITAFLICVGSGTLGGMLA